MRSQTVPTEGLQLYPDQYAPLDCTEWPGGFSGATILRIRTPSGDFCLRGWPADVLPPQRIRGLHRLLAHLSQHGLTQVAAPIPARSGETLVSARGRFWQLEPWMPGTPDFHQNPSPARLQSTMHCLAAWHLAARSFHANAEEAEWFARRRGPSPAVLERLETLRQWQAGLAERIRTTAQRDHSPWGRSAQIILNAFQRTSSAIAGELRALSSVDFDLHPCLRDIWHDHVLFTGNEVTGLIDPSACRSENVAADLARLLGSLLADDREAWRFALDEYARRRPLSLAELQLVRVLDRSGVILSGLAWLKRHAIDGENLAAAPAVLKRLEVIAARAQALD